PGLGLARAATHPAGAAGVGRADAGADRGPGDGNGRGPAAAARPDAQGAGRRDAAASRDRPPGLRLDVRGLPERLTRALQSSADRTSGGRDMGEVDRSRLGSEAEEQCVAWLERAGYQIRERNWLVREGELDIVAERDEFL